MRKERIVTIVWDGKNRLFPPAISIDFFRTRLGLWQDLKDGKPVQVPYDTATLMHGVVIKDFEDDAKKLAEIKSEPVKETPKEGEDDESKGTVGT